MSEDQKRLTDSELAQILESNPPPPLEDPDPKVRETKRTCPLCKGEGLVTPLRAEGYYTVIRDVRRAAASLDTSDLHVDPDGEEGGEL